jgi:hypothetical protein
LWIWATSSKQPDYYNYTNIFYEKTQMITVTTIVPV